MPQIANGDSGASARAMINSLLPNSVGFATAVPLDGNKIMPQQTVSAVLAFTPSSTPAAGASCYVRLIADGSHSPTFAGFTEHGSSAGYLNTAGVMNLVSFWNDGTTSWFGISQAFAAVPFVIASAQVLGNDATHVAVDFGRSLNTAIVPAASAFAIATKDSSGTSVTDATTGTVTIAGSVVTVPKTRTAIAGDTMTIAYTPPATNPVTDTNGNAASGSPNIVVSNGVAGAIQYVRMYQVSGAKTVVETTDASGYDYATAATDASYNSAAVAITHTKIPAGADGFFEYTIPTSSDPTGPISGPVYNSAWSGSYGEIDFGLYLSGNVYQSIGGWGQGQMDVSGVTGGNPPQAGDIVRWTRTGTTLTFSIKRGSASAVVVKTATGVSTAALYFGANIPSNNSFCVIKQPRGSTNVA